MKSNYSSKLIDILLDAFYPQKCIFCNSFVNLGSRYSICRDCYPKLAKQGKSVRDNDMFFEEAVCALEYSGFIKKSMRDYKFKNIRYLNKTFAYAMYNKVKNRDFIKDISIIAPVPIHPLRDRDYNQSQLMAEYISGLTTIPFCSDLLMKIKNITPLSHMDYPMRRRLIKSAIAFNTQYNIVGKNICLIDDIYTTGTTASECARVLRMHGANLVYVLSACYAPDRQGGNQNAHTDIVNN